MPLLSDASVLIDILTGAPNSAELMDIVNPDDFWVPQMCVREVLSAIAKMERAGRLTEDRARTAIAGLETMPLNWIDDQALVQKAWSYRKFLQIADAVYVAGAEQYHVPLLTTDLRLARAVRAQVPSVSVITV